MADLPDITKEALEAEKQAQTPENEVEIEVVDDTPPDDRGRTPLPKEIVEELEKDDLDEYSDKVKKKLSQMKKVWHDERREKERATREREEAIAYARAKELEVKTLRERLGTDEKAHTTAMIEAVDREIQTAKDKLKQAFESGDAGTIADAQEALMDAKVKRKELDYRRPALQPGKSEVEVIKQEQEQPQYRAVDPKPAAWKARNSWFGADSKMTGFALGLHEELITAGVDPHSDEYYKMVDKTMRETFPKYFGAAEAVEADETKEREAPAPRQKSVVAPASRSTAPHKIRLSPSAIIVAKRLGVPPEVYAKEVLKLETNNG